MTDQAQYPEPDDSPLWAPFWQSVNEGALSFMRCGSCDHAFLPPRPECPNCLQPGESWEKASGEASLVSWVVYHSVANEIFKQRLPYTVAVVELAEGPRMISNVIGVPDPESLRIDQPLSLVIEQEATTAVPRFKPVTA